ncbi:hypothetical protein [Flavobacterium sp. 3-210]
MFKITKILSDENGDSYFEDFYIPLKDAGKIGSLSEGEKVSALIFREVESTYDNDFHNPPTRQYIVLLDGGIEVETSLGDKRIFESGEVLLAENVNGKGHKTKNLENKTRRSLFILI